MFAGRASFGAPRDKLDIVKWCVANKLQCGLDGALCCNGAESGHLEMAPEYANEMRLWWRTASAIGLHPAISRRCFRGGSRMDVVGVIL